MAKTIVGIAASVISVVGVVFWAGRNFEGLTTAVGDLAGPEGMVAQLGIQVQKVEGVVTELTSDQGRLARLSGQVTDIAGKVDRMNGSIIKLETKLPQIEKGQQEADKETIGLRDKVVVIDKEVVRLDAQLVALKNRLDDIYRIRHAVRDQTVAVRQGLGPASAKAYNALLADNPRVRKVLKNPITVGDVQRKRLVSWLNLREVSDPEKVDVWLDGAPRDELRMAIELLGISNQDGSQDPATPRPDPQSWKGITNAANRKA